MNLRPTKSVEKIKIGSALFGVGKEMRTHWIQDNPWTLKKSWVSNGKGASEFGHFSSG